MSDHWPVRKLVVVESPYAGDVDLNVKYARSCLRDCLERGEAPFASHLLYTQPGVLRDEDPEERAEGIQAGLSFLNGAAFHVVYVDRGVSPGMAEAISKNRKVGYPALRYRSLRLPGQDFESLEAVAHLIGGWCVTGRTAPEYTQTAPPPGATP